MIKMLLALCILATATAATPAAFADDCDSRLTVSREARGYAILVGTMVASAAATTYLSSSLPPGFQFATHFLAQVSTLGVYVFGAPIWEPLSSRFRKLAFGVRATSVAEMDRGFEELWRRTQENYSLNQQMSRNVVTQFLISVQANFYAAHRAMTSNDPEYAADQIAEAAVRLRRLFREIEPEDESVVAAIRSAFVSHVLVDEDFRDLVAERIRTLDPGGDEAYYRRVFTAWLD